MLFEAFKEFVTDEGLDLSGRVLVGLSGGVDSSVLVDLAARVAREVVCLHVNYGLRGAESEADEQFVRDFCQDRGLELVVVDAREEMKSRGGKSAQALARSIRYREFVREAEERGVDTILLAHHADDQVETVLMSLFRGAGVNGLGGMPVSRRAGDGEVRVVRPLLFARRSEIVSYARERGLAWRDDSSNLDPKYRRSVVRRDIIPLIERHFGEAASTNILRSATLARRSANASRLISAASTVPRGARPVLRIAELEILPAVSRTRRILDALEEFLPNAPRTRAVADEIDHLIALQPGRRVQLGDSCVIRERHDLLFVTACRDESDTEGYRKSLTIGESVRVPGGIVFAHRIASRPQSLDPGTGDLAFVDGDSLGSPLQVTTWEDGDRIALLGTTGTKKVSDLLTDEKVPVSQRRLVPIVRSDGRVVWVGGIRISAEFAVDAATSTIVMLGFVRDADG